MKTLLSEKRQVAIPKKLCDQLELSAGGQIDWDVRNGLLIGIPIPRAAWKKLRGSIPTFEAAEGWKAFRQFRNEERRRV